MTVSRSVSKLAVLSASNLHKIYPGNVHAVRGIDLDLFEGEVLGLLGPNGAGKTTTISMLLGLLRPTSGSIFLFGEEISDFHSLKSLIGYAPQELVFYPFLTVYENADFFATLYNISDKSSRIYDLLNLLGLYDLRNRRSSTLSGGQKRRLNLLLSILHRPKVLFLDEPSAGMDPQSRQILWSTLKSLSSDEGISIILTTHLMEVADRLCDRVKIIDHGKVIAEGSPSDLKIRYGGNDVIEIIFDDSISSSKFNSFISHLKDRFSKIVVSDFLVKIFTKNGASLIPSVVDFATKGGVMSFITNLHLRGSTLEDVFISLTGRQLRD